MNNSNTKVCICLAAYNGYKYLPEQIGSIFCQHDVDVEIYVSVDKSTDETELWFDSIAKENDSIKLLTYGDRFGSASANFFRLIRDADFSSSQFAAFSDQDDIWQPDKLAHAVKKMQENNVDAYSSNVMAFWPNGKQKLINKAQPQCEFDFMFESAGPGCTFVLTKKLALAVQQFLKENQNACNSVDLHDWFIYAFARSRGFSWFIDGESHMFYRQHVDNVVGANVGFRATMLRFKKLRNGWLFEQALMIANILGYSKMRPIENIKKLFLRDRIWLILNVGKLRRRLRDRVALVFLMIIFVKS